MKALSVKQPWATLLVEGQKTIEVRSWGTAYRGHLLICASAAPRNVFWHDKVDMEHRLMHAGCIIGIVDLIDVRPMVQADDDASAGHFMPSAMAWVIKPVSFCRPDPISGMLKLFDVPDDKIVRIANDETDWIFNYPPPQGPVQFSDRCPVLE